MATYFTWISSPCGICKLINFVLCLIGLSLIVHFGVLVVANNQTDINLKFIYCYSIICGYLFLSTAYLVGYALDSTMGKQPCQELATSASGTILLLTAAALMFEGYARTRYWDERELLGNKEAVRKANLAAAIFILTSSIAHGCDFFFNIKNRSSSK